MYRKATTTQTSNLHLIMTCRLCPLKMIKEMLYVFGTWRSTQRSIVTRANTQRHPNHKVQPLPLSPLYLDVFNTTGGAHARINQSSTLTGQLLRRKAPSLNVTCGRASSTPCLGETTILNTSSQPWQGNVFPQERAQQKNEAAVSRLASKMPHGPCMQYVFLV